MFHGLGGGGSSSWWRFVRADEDKKPQVTRQLLARVASYARPYALKITLTLAAIIFTSILDLFPPLLFRDLIDHALPQKYVSQLTIIVLAMVAIPFFSGFIGTGQRWL